MQKEKEKKHVVRHVGRYNFKKTEDWLSEMEANGWRVCKLTNRILWTFEKCKPQKDATYFFCIHYVDEKSMDDCIIDLSQKPFLGKKIVLKDILITSWADFILYRMKNADKNKLEDYYMYRRFYIKRERWYDLGIKLIFTTGAILFICFLLFFLTALFVYLFHNP